MTSTKSYKLIYFNVRGRAEVCRFIFAQAGIKYEDQRINKGEEWPQLKPNTPTGQLPILEVDGKQLTGSGPIARFLAERHGLAGSDDFENAEIAGIMDVLGDFMQKITAFFFESDAERKAQLKKKVEDEDIPKYWGVLDGKIQKNNSANGWIYKDKPTYADFSLYCTLHYVGMVTSISKFFETYPSVAKMKAAVEGLPNIARWLKDRPQTEQ